MDTNVNNNIPASGIIPTANRPVVLQHTLESIALQNVQPAEIIIIDASSDELTRDVCGKPVNKLRSSIIYLKAKEKGAAVQRNEGVALSKQPYVLFMDDDILLEEKCIQELWNCLQSNKDAGGVNSMVTNQKYHRPGKATGFMYRIMNGKALSSYAGKCIGPVWNLLPEDNDSLPEYNEVEWLNTTCTLYRKEALPQPLFPPHFTGYSLMEDLALSLTVGKKWQLYNARNAKIFHDSQPGSHKKSLFSLSKMELVNRRFIMVKIAGRKGFKYHAKLFLFEMWGILNVLGSARGWKNLIPNLGGKFAAIGAIISGK